jgi:HAE1 family hydrophobic/amphiphilic exporter-1
MASLPFTLIGVLLALLLTGTTLNILSMIGFVMLMGLVTKNAILLIDYTKILRGRGMDRRTALITAGRTRLRPIMMTTSAMIFGMLPLFFALGQGAEFRAPMARAVVGGLITSTLLTLIVVPVVYSILDDFSAWLFRKRRPLVEKKAVAVLLAGALVTGAPGRLRAQAPPATVSMATTTTRGPQAAPGQVRMLTLEEALKIADDKNRDIEKAKEYRNWVEGKYREELSVALPHATVNLNMLRSLDASQQGLFRSFAPADGDTSISDIFGGRQDIRGGVVQFDQLLFSWGAVGAALKAAKMGFEFSDAQLARYRQAVARDVTAAFWDVLIAREFENIAQQALDQRQRHLDETKKRQAAGTATDFDVLAAEVGVQNVRPTLIRSANDVRVARDQLALLLAETGDIDVVGTLDTAPAPVPGYDEVLAKALENRPELAEFRTQIGIAGELVKIAKSHDKPSVSFSGAFGVRNLGLTSIQSTGRAWNAGVNMNWPIFDGYRTRGQVIQAQSTATSLSIDDLKVRESIAVQVRTAVNAVNEAAEILSAAGGTVKQAEQLLTLAEKGFELGVKTRLDVQDAQLNVSTARANLARAQRDYRVARVNLEWVAGTVGTWPK